ncbi:hypothetical protein FC19_GL002224 [Liquorilactobacillus aquaticus DSM 21051]|uniref:Biotin carboxyl carrier protein of acetyl-CoA carboxylase n=1 Tax=Liquorilactobacillus aquaticus DSM 21051 TaxID=1423725 RepID=A0A0R2CUY0_9LACO|nr:acetyl-CoA carboxylase biotin carboxyl carrier protein [Liquorilactobacillus aquaticus]KRM95130.1 hypothetical protein FC19_GL002224 [Liquorilactobacillus aquaticus DSM 21051]
MEIEKIESLIKLFGRSDLARLEVEEKDARIVLERKNDAAALEIESNADRAVKKVDSESTKEVATEGEIVKAPLVGTLYTAPEPDKPTFVKIGDRVKKGQTIAIIEVMKMMNEIKAPADGIIAAILVENGTVVEYDQALFELEN